LFCFVLFFFSLVCSVFVCFFVCLFAVRLFNASYLTLKIFSVEAIEVIFGLF